MPVVGLQLRFDEDLRDSLFNTVGLGQYQLGLLRCDMDCAVSLGHVRRLVTKKPDPDAPRRTTWLECAGHPTRSMPLA